MAIIRLGSGSATGRMICTMASLKNRITGNARAITLTLIAFVFSSVSRAATIELSKVVDPRDASIEWYARPATNKTTAENKPLRIAGREYARGLGTQVNTAIFIKPNGATRFTAKVGVDDASGGDHNTLVLRAAVFVDGREVWSNDTLRYGKAPVDVSVEFNNANAKEIRLVAEDTGHALSDWGHVDWIDAAFDYTGEAPKSIPAVLVVEAPYILTPKSKPEPRINSPRAFGARPGHPFIYTIAATGARPMQFFAENLPDGLSFDAARGRITGSVAKSGTYNVVIGAKNKLGAVTQTLRIEIGELLALTPPLGWNSWNCWGASVDQKKILAAANAMVKSGLIDHGWSYINIDDSWQAVRGGPFNAIQPNEKFPDMRGLTDAVHNLGLKIGIYSTPWKTSYATHCGGSADTPDGAWTKPEHGADGHYGVTGPWSIGKYSFAAGDAKQWAAWGIDYLKYDWNPNRFPETEEMYKALRASGRDIIFSLSNSMPYENIAQIMPVANVWRTTGDIADTWAEMQRLGFVQNRWRKYGGPGHWNDPDMLVVGWLGWGPDLHPTRLTPSEQYTHIALWSLLCSPLLIGCDLTRLDDFTLNLLTNDEVLEVNQDPLGDQAAKVWADGRRQVWMKTLEDGSHAIGVFNLSQKPDTIEVNWQSLGLKKPSRVRDLWRQRDLEKGKTAFTDAGISVTPPAHGCYLLRVWE